MTTEEQADSEALWPQGTDVSGLRAMCQGLLSQVLAWIAVYVGTSNARGMVVQLANNDEFWVNVSQQAPSMRDVLREQDELGKAMDDAERKMGKDN